MTRLVAYIIGVFGTVATCISGATAQSTLQIVRQRDELRCGIGTGLAGFYSQDSNGQWNGFNVDLCRAVAAAIFNDPNRVSFRPLSAKDRYVALLSGEVDLLISNATWTISRDTTLGVNFAPVAFYDGQVFMTKKELGVQSAKSLGGATICIQQGTTTELNTADFFRSARLHYQLIAYATSEEVIKSYDLGRCDAVTGDSSYIAAARLTLQNSSDHVILPEIISKEPLAPVVRQGDDQWFDLVKWVYFAMVSAEELGVSQSTVEMAEKSDDPSVRRLIGAERNIGEGIGLSPDWALRILIHVGNYGEVYERHLGLNSRIKLERGINKLWKHGGLHYAPPFR
jgi:general L-amino acid transport system substrate-binding protein